MGEGMPREIPVWVSDAAIWSEGDDHLMQATVPASLLA